MGAGGLQEQLIQQPKGVLKDPGSFCLCSQSKFHLLPIISLLLTCRENSHFQTFPQKSTEALLIKPQKSLLECPWPWLGHMSTFHPILGKKVGLRLEQLCSRGGVRLSESPRMQRVAEYSWPSQGPFSNEDGDGWCQISCQQYPPLHSHRGISITLDTSLSMLNMCAGPNWLEFQVKLTQCWMGLPSSKVRVPPKMCREWKAC